MVREATKEDLHALPEFADRIEEAGDLAFL